MLWYVGTTFVKGGNNVTAIKCSITIMCTIYEYYMLSVFILAVCLCISLVMAEWIIVG